MNPDLTIETLKKAAKEFCEIESSYQNTDLYGVTDGKAVGTYIEHKFKNYLKDHIQNRCHSLRNELKIRNYE